MALQVKRMFMDEAMRKQKMQVMGNEEDKGAYRKVYYLKAAEGTLRSVSYRAIQSFHRHQPSLTITQSESKWKGSRYNGGADELQPT